ncbi:conserved exported protein of unknown function [Rhodovastum atsumiense]|uniref:Lipoprotein n=1 Tax=Rhodovastum atsumiense TaxID=504468 RepID=A0A5M6IVV1_9PROT|nr:hypothetical protein [Rhodovastum atsumiense]KAA5612412.1 hypothetical protein F1189_09550 [Rhodovastum atsumiense]CAH2600318.1 conserved exported protein of unknown function [Rhodovastum atsumiense]
MRHGILLLALLAGACSNWTSYAAFDDTSPDTLRGQCERAAYDDPAVKEELAKAAGVVGTSQDQWVLPVKKIKEAAVQRCMLKRGGPMKGGGVELPIR